MGGPGKIGQWGGKCPECGDRLWRSNRKLFYSCEMCGYVSEPDDEPVYLGEDYIDDGRHRE
jgi:uncharacterized protein (DUF983 family)